MQSLESLEASFLNLFEGLDGVVKKKMMGGSCFLLRGHMLGGVGCGGSPPNHYMFRVGKQNEAVTALLTGGTPVMKGGRRMGGMFFVHAGESNAEHVIAWAALAASHALSLPPKG